MARRNHLGTALAVALAWTGGEVAWSRELAPPPDADARLRRILDDWQRRSAASTSLEVRFTGDDLSPSWGDKSSFAGRVILRRDGRALVDLLRPATEGWGSETQRFLYTADTIHEVRPGRAEHFVWPISDGDRGRLPSVLALPFLWNVTVEGLESRYRVRLVKEDAKTWVLELTALGDPRLDVFSRALLQLDRATYLPRRYYVISGDGKSAKDYRVTDAGRDRPVDEGDFRLPDDGGKAVRMLETERVWLSRFFKPTLLP